MDRDGAGFLESEEATADESSLGPEDYAWLALVDDASPYERLPRLQWVWDRSDRELNEHLIALAALRPLGSA
jgi:hypothetical protein